MIWSTLFGSDDEQEGAGGHEEAVDGGDEGQHEKQWKGDLMVHYANTAVTINMLSANQYTSMYTVYKHIIIPVHQYTSITVCVTVRLNTSIIEYQYSSIPE